MYFERVFFPTFETAAWCSQTDTGMIGAMRNIVPEDEIEGAGEKGGKIYAVYLSRSGLGQCIINLFFLFI